MPVHAPVLVVLAIEVNSFGDLCFEDRLLRLVVSPLAVHAIESLEELTKETPIALIDLLLIL